MEEKTRMDERNNQPRYFVSDDLTRPPLYRYKVDPQEIIKNQLKRNGDREHSIPKQNKLSQAKKSKNKSKKFSNENKASIENANEGVIEEISGSHTGSNESETEQNITSEFPDVEPQSTWIHSDIEMRKIETPDYKMLDLRARSVAKYSSSSTLKDKNKSVPVPKNIFPKSSGLSWKNINWVLLLGIVCGALLMIYLFYNSSYFKPSISIEVLNVAAIVSQLEPDFDRQPTMSFTIIRSALKAVSKPRVSKTAISKSTDTSEPDAPAIILLLAAEGAEELTSNLGRKLAETVSRSPIHIRGSDYTYQESNEGKKKIDDVLRNLSNNSYDAVLVEDLHLIPGSIALMFHTYCDHENAPYKRVVYVMTVASESRIPKDSKGKFWDETVRKRLSRSWNDIDNDQMEPLLTRLTVGVAAITADSD